LHIICIYLFLDAATQTKWSLAALLWIGAIFVTLIDYSYAINLV